MIEIKNLYKRFSNKEVLKDVSFSIEKGDIFGIVGHSGAGKSTLLRCLNGLESYTEGSIAIDGKEVKNLTSNELRNLRKDLGMIFQNFNLMTSKNVFQNIALPMELWGYNKNTIQQKVDELLTLVGLEDKKTWSITKLSGGQKQRVGIARALALNPKILLCDEATSALDPKTTKSILQLLREINNKLNITIVIVTHQMEVIKEICNKVVLMEDGEIKGYGDVEELFLKPTEELERLLGEEELLPSKGINIKLFFSKESSENSIITSMARELDIDFSIVWGKLEKFRDDVLGSLVINVEEAHKDKIVQYLKDKGIGMEVL
ncbi:methionine ABC transporter ATP-binding protein [Clostridium thermarum]|uniref:methionine ABC transporter ATP-binding protein n=1 Tax=Clostridium thermarum TaxID=1716543 RepID=UPI00111E7A5F|nr:methionine ABC transporter ATP-binding protein [Clostridium thermarum]